MHIHFMEADDWVALYIDNKLVTQGHSLRPDKCIETVLNKLGVEYTLDGSWHPEESKYILSGFFPDELPMEMRHPEGEA